MQNLQRVTSVWIAAILLSACQGKQASVADADKPADIPVNASASADREVERILDMYVAAAEQRVAAPACLRADQAEWLQQTAQRCGTQAACLTEARVQRARLLEGVVPGAVMTTALDQYPQGSEASLLAVVGGTQESDLSAADLQQLESITFEGIPLESEGGYVLVDADFDQRSYDDFNALMGDEDALRQRFGDGPIVIRGLVAGFPSEPFDVGDRAALDQASAAKQKVRVRGWAFPQPDAAPSLDPRRCLLLYRLAPATR